MLPGGFYESVIVYLFVVHCVGVYERESGPLIKQL